MDLRCAAAKNYGRRLYFSKYASGGLYDKEEEEGEEETCWETKDTRLDLALFLSLTSKKVRAVLPHCLSVNLAAKVILANDLRPMMSIAGPAFWERFDCPNGHWGLPISVISEWKDFARPRHTRWLQLSAEARDFKRLRGVIEASQTGSASPWAWDPNRDIDLNNQICKCVLSLSSAQTVYRGYLPSSEDLWLTDQEIERYRRLRKEELQKFMVGGKHHRNFYWNVGKTAGI